MTMQSLFYEEPHMKSNGWQIWLNVIHALTQVTEGFLLFVCHFHTLQSLLYELLHFISTIIPEVDGIDVVING